MQGPFYGVEGDRVVGPFDDYKTVKERLHLAPGTHNDEILVPGKLYRYGAKFIGTAYDLHNKNVVHIGRYKDDAPLHHWTTNPLTGRSNSSAEFVKLTQEVEKLIRSSAHDLISGQTGAVAGLIMAQLAHVHNLAPAKKTS